MSSDTLALRGTKAEALSESVIREVFGGRLFTDNFLARELIQLTDSESGVDDDEVKRFYNKVESIFSEISADAQFNEDETQEEVIYPILDILKWEDRVAKKNLGLLPRDLRQVPDGLLFLDKAAKAKSREPENKKNPYPFGKVVLENKKFGLSLEDREGIFSAPSMQILAYLSRAEVVSKGEIQWGFLANGAEWRLYYQKAQSVAEQFFSVRLDRLFSEKILPNKIKENEDYDEKDKKDSELNKLTCFKIFLLIFGKQAFQHNFHQSAISKVKSDQQEITESITNEIFYKIYEKLAIAIAEQAEESTGEQIKQATLKILYRILFILYAEDRELLPMGDHDAYRQHYSLKRLRRRLQREGIPRASNNFLLWDDIKNLCKIINEGDSDLEIPKYNGGLFKDDDVPLLSKIKIPDSIMGETLYSLSYHGADYINYRNLNVEQLGSIYESLLERDMIKESGKPKIFVSKYDRKKTGSYYTPEELVSSVIKQATEPAYQKYIDTFKDKVAVLEKNKDKGDAEKNKILEGLDPATAILNQKICDPAMGSGHFLVSLTDSLTDQVIKALAQAENEAPKEWKYQSPLREDIDGICDTIRDNAEKSKYEVKEDHLQDRHIIRRIVLKSCIYGVDKNPTAVELAKLSLWLHTFTVGAPLSFLDHHLKCGDSLFGLTMRTAEKKIKTRSGSGGLFDDDKMQGIINKAAEKMRGIAKSTDSEIKEVKESEETYNQVQKDTESLKKALLLIHAGDWFRAFASNQIQKVIMELEEKEKINQVKEAERRRQLKEAVNGKLSLINQLLDGEFGNYLDILRAPDENLTDKVIKEKIKEMLAEAEALDKEENFFHWDVEFPEVWQYPDGDSRNGFDAIIGNPPWDKVRLEKIEWFAKRDETVAKIKKKDVREAKIKKLKESNPPLYAAYIKAEKQARIKSHVARDKDTRIYKDLNKGEINLYKLFIERSRQLLSNDGLISLIVPSGIVFDKSTASFFKELVESKYLKSFYDFENGRIDYSRPIGQRKQLDTFFDEVHRNFKFCILTHATHALEKETAQGIHYGCFLRSTEDIADSEKCFYMKNEDFNLMNPYTGTLVIFRDPRDKKLIIEIYRNHPILGYIDDVAKRNKWQVKPVSVLHPTGDSHLFVDKNELDKANCYPIGNNHYENSEGIWLPLYKGAMFNLHDHRAAKLKINPNNVHVQRSPDYTTLEQHQDPNYLPPPLYWVKESEKTDILKQDWVIAFRDITNSINQRTFITAILPRAAYENTGLFLVNESNDKSEYLLYANFSSIPFDYIARNKIHDIHMAWFILHQLPVIDVDIYDSHKFGNKTAGEVIREIILELVYTAHNLRGFAEDLDYVDDKGEAKPPFKWNEHRRLSLCAKLDAIYFILYGITENDDIEYIYNTFTILAKEQKKQFNDTYKRLELCLHYKNALLNGECDIFYEVLG